MKFTVLWTRYAEPKLTLLWVGAIDRQSVADAADKIDKLLRRDADTVRESRARGRRIVHEPPLGVIFSLNEQDRLVRVLDVWLF